MAMIEFLSVAQIRRRLGQIRGNLAELRRWRASMETTNTKSTREAPLDVQISKLYQLRLDLEHQIRCIGSASELTSMERQMIADATEVLAATGEMMDLLRWPGARNSSAVVDLYNGRK